MIYNDKNNIIYKRLIEYESNIEISNIENKFNNEVNIFKNIILKKDNIYKEEVIASNNFKSLLEYRFELLEKFFELFYRSNNIYSIQIQDEIIYFEYLENNFIPRDTRLYFIPDTLFTLPMLANGYYSPVINLKEKHNIDKNIINGLK